MRQLKTAFFALIFATLFSTGAAFASAADEAFVQNKASEALSILADKTLDKSAKAERFQRYVDKVTDVPRIARFVLGKYRRGVDPQKLNEFTTVFRQYASGVYEAQLDNFHGETLKVTGSQDRKPGDSIVNSVVSGGQIEEPLTVNWRIRSRDGVHKVVDVQVFGIWLALQQRNEITSVIANNGGNIDAAIAVLNTKIATGNFGAPEGANAKK